MRAEAMGTGDDDRRPPRRGPGKRVRFAVIVGAVAGVFTALLGPALLAARPPATSPSEIYAALKRDADAGDKRAKDMLAAVDAYTKEHGLSIEDMGPLGPGTTATKALGPIRLRVEDHAPWAISIRNLTELRTKSALNAYVALRTGALRSMASSTPGRGLQVVVTPNQLMDVDDFLGSLVCACTAYEVVVDVFVGGEWAYMAFHEVDAGPGLIASDVIAQEERAALRLFPNATKDDLRLTVRRVSLRIDAGDARRVSDRADVLLVDALDDLADAYRGRAAQIDVSGGVDAFYAHAVWNLGVTLDATPSGPGSGREKP